MTCVSLSCRELPAALPASCTFSTAFVISAFKASVSSAVTEPVTGSTVKRHKMFKKKNHAVYLYHLWLVHVDVSLILSAAAWPVSWATTLVASVTMLSEETVTMLNSLSEVDAPGHTSAPSSELPPATTRRFMPAFPWWTVLTWERRLSTLLNPRPHLSHRKGFSPAKARDAH